VVVPTSEAGQESLLAGVAGQFGGLGALAGFGDLSPEKIESVETLRSTGLARKFIREQGVVQILCRARLTSCDSDDESNENAALRAITRGVLGVSDDRRTGVVRVTMTWIDRGQAATWANDYVALANRELQGRAVTEASQRVIFLEKAAAATDDHELRSAIYRLIEAQVKTQMLASTRPEYAFRVIDSAAPPDKKDRVRPLRSLIALTGAVAGLGLAYGGMLAIARLRRSAARLPASR
jgi:hypothetical protein